MKLTPIQYKLQNIKNNVIIDSMIGNYKGYVWNHKFLASAATENFDQFITLPKEKISVPLFSRMGFNMLFVTIKDIFRKKTPEEKLFKKMLLKHKAKDLVTKGM